jgi:hypothetical protein
MNNPMQQVQTSQPHRRRLQFSLLSLFVLMTSTCAVLTWLVWPKSVGVVAQVMASTLTVSPTGSTIPQPKFVDYQAKLLAAFEDPEILKDAVAITGNGDLPMLRGKRDPLNWVRKRLEVEAAPNSIISVKLTVPEYFKQNAIEFVDYITFRAVTKTIRDIEPLPRTRLPELVAQRLALERTINATSQRLERSKRVAGTGSPVVAAIEAELETHVDAWKRLGEQIEAGKTAQEFVSQVRFVQTATAVDKS